MSSAGERGELKVWFVLVARIRGAGIKQSNAESHDQLSEQNLFRISFPSTLRHNQESEAHGIDFGLIFQKPSQIGG